MGPFHTSTPVMLSCMALKRRFTPGSRPILPISSACLAPFSKRKSSDKHRIGGRLVTLPFLSLKGFFHEGIIIKIQLFIHLVNNV
jgi:hypothetical protein